MDLRLAAINRFPVKSCRGAAVESAIVEPWGLAGDRRWLVVDDAGDLLTARENPRMLLIVPAIRPDGGLDVTGPDVPALTVPVPRDDRLVPVRVWDSELLATAAGDEASAWFGKVLGRSARLVYLDDPTRRHPNPRFARPTDYVSFADGYPLLLATTGSLDQLNEWIAQGRHAAEGPLPMIRFRPSVVIDGSPPWVEDGWRRVRIGAAEFRAVKGCDRCVLTMTDPDTTERGKEPIATLARYRRWDGATWFGMNLIPDTPGATITVGDEVEVLESVPAPDGPPR
ncbi:MAG TPA: MOSC N-terminal beta barrel domain-containing protein [Jatrophihabitans sp.]|nr:MOSC N-terminal beta barrel domain-containing protein [Jatrophihabitans sp.]